MVRLRKINKKVVNDCCLCWRIFLIVFGFILILVSIGFGVLIYKFGNSGMKPVLYAFEWLAVFLI